MFITRSLVNFATIKLLRTAEKQRREDIFAKDGFNLFSLPVTKKRGKPKPNRLKRLNYIITHVTGVDGGYGVSKRAVNRWEVLVKEVFNGESNALPQELIDQLKESGAWLLEDTRSLARRIAMWERYRGTTPYHQMGSQNGDNLTNRELEFRTPHAGSGNFGAGWALDVGGQEELDGFLIETGRASLRTLRDRILATKSNTFRTDYYSKIKVDPHRCFSKNRLGDCGIRVYQEVVLPVVQERESKLEIDYNMHIGKGRPVPNTWDPNAEYDAKGREL